MKKENIKLDFQTPEGYFDTLTSRIMDRVVEVEERYGEKDDFKVPHGYLDTLTEKVLQRVEEGNRPVISLPSYKKYYYAAASIAAVFLLYAGLTWNNAKAPNYSDLARSDIEGYFDYNGWEFSSYDLAEIIALEEVDLNSMWDRQLENDNVIEYLSINIKDLEELNLEQDD